MGDTITNNGYTFTLRGNNLMYENRKSTGNGITHYGLNFGNNTIGFMCPSLDLPSSHTIIVWVALSSQGPGIFVGPNIPRTVNDHNFYFQNSRYKAKHSGLPIVAAISTTPNSYDNITKKCSMYSNGILVAFGEASVAWNGGIGSGLCIGSNALASGCVGHLNMVRIYDISLSQTDILQLYNYDKTRF